MAKRKTKVESVEETTPPERVHKAGGQAEIVSGERWHILYTPQWRTQIDMGEFDGTAQQTFAFVIDWLSKQPESKGNPFFVDKREVKDGVWIARGFDGVQETTLPLVTITRVTGGVE